MCLPGRSITNADLEAIKGVDTLAGKSFYTSW
jgi:hypothetical protein